MYTKVYLSFEKFSMFLKVVLKVCCDVCFEKWKGLFCKFDQVTKSLSTPKFTQRFFLCFNPFNNFVPPLYLVDNLVLGC